MDPSETQDPNQNLPGDLASLASFLDAEVADTGAHVNMPGVDMSPYVMPPSPAGGNFFADLWGPLSGQLSPQDPSPTHQGLQGSNLRFDQASAEVIPASDQHPDVIRPQQVVHPAVLSPTRGPGVPSQNQGGSDPKPLQPGREGEGPAFAEAAGASSVSHGLSSSAQRSRRVLPARFGVEDEEDEGVGPANTVVSRSVAATSSWTQASDVSTGKGGSPEPSSSTGSGGSNGPPDVSRERTGARGGGEGSGVLSGMHSPALGEEGGGGGGGEGGGGVAGGGGGGVASEHSSSAAPRSTATGPRGVTVRGPSALAGRLAAVLGNIATKQDKTRLDAAQTEQGRQRQRNELLSVLSGRPLSGGGTPGEALSGAGPSGVTVGQEWAEEEQLRARVLGSSTASTSLWVQPAPGGRHLLGEAYLSSSLQGSSAARSARIMELLTSSGAEGAATGSLGGTSLVNEQAHEAGALGFSGWGAGAAALDAGASGRRNLEQNPGILGYSAESQGGLDAPFMRATAGVGPTSWVSSGSPGVTSSSDQASGGSRQELERLLQASLDEQRGMAASFPGELGTQPSLAQLLGIADVSGRGTGGATPADPRGVIPPAAGRGPVLLPGLQGLPGQPWASTEAARLASSQEWIRGRQEAIGGAGGMHLGSATTTVAPRGPGTVAGGGYVVAPMIGARRGRGVVISELDEDEEGAVSDEGHRLGGLSAQELAGGMAMVRKKGGPTWATMNTGQDARGRWATNPWVLQRAHMQSHSGAVNSVAMNSVTVSPAWRTPAAPFAVDPVFFSTQFRKGAEEKLRRLAEAYCGGQRDVARDQLMSLEEVASPIGSSTQRLLFYMLAALQARFEGKEIAPPPPPPPGFNVIAAAQESISQVWGHFCENAMAFSLASSLQGYPKIHLILFTITSTPDWTTLFLSLANQEGVTPSLRLSIVVPYVGAVPLPHIQMAFLPLRDQAIVAGERLGFPIKCSIIFSAPAEFNPELVKLDPEETLAVADWLALKTLPDSSVLRHSPRDSFLRWVADLQPVIFTIVESDGNFNSPFFMSRFDEVLRSIGAILDNFDSTGDHRLDTPSPGSVLEQFVAMYLMNCVACDGLGRFERAESMAKWRDRLQGMGFREKHLKDETLRALGSHLRNNSASVESVRGFASLRWDNVPIMFAASWDGRYSFGLPSPNSSTVFK